MNKLILTILLMAASALGAWAQNQANVLRAIENSQLITLKNGFRIQIVKTGEYKYVNCRMSADISTLHENTTPGIKQVVAAVVGGDLVANEVIVKNMISHEQALDSLMMFMSEVMYGNNAQYINFKDYKERRVRAMRMNGESLSDMASRIIGLPTVTAEGLDKITQSEFEEYRRLCFSPERCLLTVVSNADSKDISALAEKYFGTQVRREYKSKTSLNGVNPLDRIHLIPDTVSTKYEAIYKHYYLCDKTPKNYIHNQLAYYMMYGNYLSDCTPLSCFKYDVNTLHTEKGNGDFEKMVQNIYEPRNPKFKNEPVLNEAKKKMITEFKARFSMPDYAAELASALVLYNFPKNYFSTYEQTIRAVTTTEAQQFINSINDKGSSILLIRGNERDLHCPLMAQAEYRDVIISTPGKNELEVRINKGFNVNYVINQYLKVSGLAKAPKNLQVTFRSTYEYPDGSQYHGKGIIQRKTPNMYKLENYIIHQGDSTGKALFHYREMYDGANASDSSALYGLADMTPMRAQALKQKATFPQEASYEELGMKARLICSYSDFMIGLIKVAVTEASGQNYHDYYSISTGLRERTDIINHQGRNVKTIYYEYAQADKYMLPSKATEISPEIKTTIEFDSYDLETSLKKTDFQLESQKNKQ